MPTNGPATIRGLDALTGAEVDVDGDQIPIADASAGAAGTKRITPRELIANSASFTASGSGVTSESVQDILRTFITPQMFGGVGDGVTDDQAAVLAASVAAVDQKKAVLFVGTWLIGSQIALTSSHTGLKWVLWGATIKKGFNGDLVANSGAQDFAVDGNGVIDGQHGTFTGKGFVFSTNNSDNPVFGPGIKITSFTDSHIEFGANAGQNAKVLCDFEIGSGQSEFRAVHCTGTDTSAMHRRFTGCAAPAGYIDLDSVNGVDINGGRWLRIETHDDNSIVTITGSSAEFGTISGVNTYVHGCRITGDTTLDAAMSGAFVGNDQTSGTFTDNTTAGECLVLHINGAAGEYTRIGKHILNNTPSTGHVIRREASASAGDAAVSWNIGTQTILRYATTLTADRAVTLGTTSVSNGQTVSVVRTAGNTGGPWGVDVGGLKTLAQNEWCEVFYNGSAWQLGKFGSANAAIFTQSGSGAVSTPVQDIIRQFAVNVFSYIPTAEWAAIIAGTSTTDVSSYIQAALDAHPGRWIYFPKGTYVITAQLVVDDGDGTILIGEGVKSIIKKGANLDGMIALGKLGQIVLLTLEGQGGTYTGRGVVVAGAPSAGGDEVSWVRITDASILNMASYCVEFTTARAGYAAQLTNVRMTLDGANKWTTYCIKQPDSEANNGNRMYTACWSYGHRLIDLGQADNTLMVNCQGGLPLFNASSKKTQLVGCRLVTTGDGDSMLWVIDGISTVITGCTLNGTFDNPGVEFASGLAQCSINGNAWVSGLVFDDNALGQSASNEIDIRNVTYTPAWTGAGNPAIGDGALSGAYQRDGERCHFNIVLTAGSTTTYGTGAWSLSLPYTAVRDSVVSVYMEDATGPAVYLGQGYIQQDAATVRIVSSTVTAAYVKSDNPFTWASGDKLRIEGDYVIK
jgi:hypothetical protein